MKLITPLALLGAAIGLFFLFISPQYKNLNDLRDQAKQYDDAIVRAQKVGVERDQLLAKKSSFSQSDIKRLQKFLPDTVDPVQFIIDMNTVANRYGANITGIKIGGDDTQKSGTPVMAATSTDFNPVTALNTTPMSFSISLTYNQFQKYLADLEKSLRLIDISNITFKPTAGADAVYDFSVTVRTYSLK